MNALKNTLLIGAAICFVAIIGAGTYEHLTSVPVWKQALPRSLSMFQGEYGINTAAFWIRIHPVTIVLMIAALIANWKTSRRKYILITFGGYVLVLIITAIYFVPELMALTGTKYSDTVDASLVARANLWEKLSLIRGVFLISLTSVLLFSLTKPVK